MPIVAEILILTSMIWLSMEIHSTSPTMEDCGNLPIVAILGQTSTVTSLQFSFMTLQRIIRHLQSYMGVHKITEHNEPLVPLVGPMFLAGMVLFLPLITRLLP